MYRRIVVPSLLAALACVRGETHSSTSTAIADTVAGAQAPAAVALATVGEVAPSGASTPAAPRTPNELGRIPLFEYHLIGDKNATYERERTQFREDLELMYARGYRPVSMSEMLDRKIDLPAGLSPMVLVFDDASPSQFRYIERNGKLEIDPTSAVGILLDFAKSHPGWRNRAVFCLLPAAQAGRSFFGDKGIEGQKTEWRYQKVRFLHEQGFELCNHTLYHARLDRAGEKVQEFIARGEIAIDSVIPGYRVRALALPLGMWPKNRELAHQGSWRDPRSGKVISYRYDAILEVAGGPARSPYDPQFNPLSVPRVPVVGNVVQQVIDQLEKSGTGYVSDGDPATIARPPHVAAAPAKAPPARAPAASRRGTR